jgi:UDP-glucose 4-epimerase
VVVRLFNTVGPRQTGRYGMVLPTFVRQALMGQPITVFGDGTQSRCFSDVGEVVAALAALAQAPEAEGQVVNVGSSQEITIGELAELVRGMCGSKSEITLVPYDEAYEEGFEDMARRVPDCAKLQRLVGFAPSRPVREIVDSVIAYYRQR